MWWLWSEPSYRPPRRAPGDVVMDTLLMELSWQLREAELAQRRRSQEQRRRQTGVDYGWLVTEPARPPHPNLAPGERLGLEELCSQIPPSHCGQVIYRFRQVLQDSEPEAAEVSGVFRAVVVEVLDQAREDEENRRLARQWSGRRATSALSLASFRPRGRINPFGSTVGLTAEGAELRTVSQDVERGPGLGAEERGPPRVWSMPDFRSKGLGGKVV